MLLQKNLQGDAFIKSPAKKLYSLSFFLPIAICILTSLLMLLPVNNPIAYYFIKTLQLVLFFAFGNRHISSMQNSLQPCTVQKQQVCLLLHALILCAVLTALYLVLKKEIWLMAISSTTAFMLPFYLRLSWHLFTTVPGKKFDAWYPRAMTSHRDAVSLSSILLKLRLTQHADDEHEKIYRVFVPPYIKLGDYFSHILSDYDTHAASSIEYSNAGNKYAWEFFTTGFYGLQIRRLDPDLTIVDNKIRKGAIIYIKRLMQPAELSSYNKKII